MRKIMFELRWIRTSLFLTLLLQSTATTGQYSSFTVRVGDGVALPCENVICGQDKCDGTTWIFSGSRNIVDLVTLGKIHENAKSGRLSVTANCSLVIKNVTVEDAGRYDCQQYKSEQQQGEDRLVQLSVITMTEREDSEQVTLSCSLWTHNFCRHTVKWLYEGEHVDEDKTYMETLDSWCSVTFVYLKQSSKYHKLFKCEVTDGYNNQVQQFPFRPEKPVEDATTTTTTTTLTKRTSVTSKNIRTNSAGPAVSNTPTPAGSWWLYVCVAVGLVALVIIIVTAVRWKRTKGNKTHMDDNTELSLNPAVTRSAPETTQDMPDPEDGVSYASISYTKKTTSEGRVQVRNDDDEGDAVTYSTVKASSSSAGASDDPSALYATIKKPDK